MADEESLVEALHRFRDYKTDAERWEALFIGQFESIQVSKRVDMRLDILNGTTQRTKEALQGHLEEHGDQTKNILYIKRWGARGTALVVAMLALLGGVEAFVRILQVIHGW